MGLLLHIPCEVHQSGYHLKHPPVGAKSLREEGIERCCRWQGRPATRLFLHIPHALRVIFLRSLYKWECQSNPTSPSSSTAGFVSPLAYGTHALASPLQPLHSRRFCSNMNNKIKKRAKHFLGSRMIFYIRYMIWSRSDTYSCKITNGIVHTSLEYTLCQILFHSLPMARQCLRLGRRVSKAEYDEYNAILKRSIFKYVS